MSHVLDALDECKSHDRSRLIRQLSRFHELASKSTSSTQTESRRSYLKFLVTSRPYSDFEADFELSTHLPSIRLRGEDENEQIREEINVVIKGRVAHLAKSLNMKPQTKDQIEHTLLKMKHRTYLWLYLAIDGIRETFRNSFRPDEEPIECLPTTVEDAYEKILSRIQGENQSKVKLIFQIVVGAKRPLTIGEMAIALGIATYPQPITLKDSRLSVEHLGRQIRHLCGLFVFISHSRLYLIHQTAKEFLIQKQGSQIYETTWKHSLDPVRVDEVLAYVCIDFLLLEDIDQNGEILQKKLRLNKPLSRLVDEQNDVECFLAYTAVNWVTHSREAVSKFDRLSLDKIMKLYDIEASRKKWWFDILWRSQSHTDTDQTYPFWASLLFWATSRSWNFYYKTMRRM